MEPKCEKWRKGEFIEERNCVGASAPTEHKGADLCKLDYAKPENSGTRATKTNDTQHVVNFWMQGHSPITFVLEKEGQNFKFGRKSDVRAPLHPNKNPKPTTGWGKGTLVPSSEGCTLRLPSYLTHGNLETESQVLEGLDCPKGG